MVRQGGAQCATEISVAGRKITHQPGIKWMGIVIIVIHRAGSRGSDKAIHASAVPSLVNGRPRVCHVVNANIVCCQDWGIRGVAGPTWRDDVKMLASNSVRAG